MQNECNPRLLLTQFKIALDLLKMCFWFKLGIILSPRINSEPSKLVEKPGLHGSSCESWKSISVDATPNVWLSGALIVQVHFYNVIAFKVCNRTLLNMYVNFNLTAMFDSLLCEPFTSLHNIQGQFQFFLLNFQRVQFFSFLSSCTPLINSSLQALRLIVKSWNRCPISSTVLFCLRLNASLHHWNTIQGTLVGRCLSFYLWTNLTTFKHIWLNCSFTKSGTNGNTSMTGDSNQEKHLLSI